MSNALKVVLTGIIIILSSLFFMGVCILNRGGGPQGLTLALFIIGVIVSIIGLFFVKEDEEDDEE
ncbi:MAG: hypothetical protein J1E40_09185 [Oscillospiraceae bacterium]|nr:hypothetical protein [Oscillospiraceae bacterium]